MISDGRLVFDTSLDRSGLEAGLRQAQSDTANLSNTASVALGTLAGNAAAQVVSAVKNSFTQASSFIVETGKQFEASMSQVSATMGITTAAEEYSMLTAAAKKMGAETKYSASQAGEALNYLALAGYDAEKAVSALPTVLNVASAGGIDLAYASDMITDSMSALGLEMDKLETFSDQLAKTSQKSNTSVAQLGEGILTVGGTAKTLSGGVAELNTMLGLIADNGIKGAEGGTALRNIILSLSAPTDKAAAALERLKVSAFDNQGNLRELSEVFGDLNNALAPLTEQQKTEILNEIFNKVDLKSVNALLGTSSERFKELRAEIENCNGAASQMADTMSDNLQGDIAIFNSSLEAVGNTAYESIAGTLRTSVQSVTEVLGRLNTALDGQMGDRLGAVAEKLGDIAVRAAEFAVDKGIPKLIDCLEWVCDNDDELITAAKTAGTLIIAYKGLSAAGSAATAISQFAAATSGAASATEVLKIALAGNWWAGAIAGAVALGVAIRDVIEAKRELIGYEGEVKEAYNQANKEIALRNQELLKLSESENPADRKKAFEESEKDIEEYTRKISENTEKLKQLPKQVLEADRNGDEALADALTQEIDGLFEQNTFLESALTTRRHIIEENSMWSTGLSAAMGNDAAKRAEEEAKKHFKSMETQTASAIVSQEELTKELAEKWSDLDHKYAMGIIADDSSLYAKRLELLNKYGDESNTEHWKYYEQIHAYEKSAHETELKELKELGEKRVSELNNNLDTVNELYKEQYSKLLEQQKSYRQRLMSVGGSLFSITVDKDENGQETKTTKINDIKKQIADMKAYHEDIKKLKEDGASSALLAELNSVSTEDAMRTADYIANLSESERANVIKLYKEKEAVANTLSAELYADEARSMQEEFAAVLTDMGVNSYAAGVVAAEQFADGFNGKLSELMGASYEISYAPLLSSAAMSNATGTAYSTSSDKQINVMFNVSGGKMELDGQEFGRYSLNYDYQVDVQKG